MFKIFNLFVWAKSEYNNECINVLIVKGKKVSPFHIITRIEESVYFYCAYESNVMTWYFEEGPLPNNAITIGSSNGYSHALMIQDVRLDNAGTYTCRGQEYEFLSESEGTLNVTSTLHNLVFSDQN